VSKILNKINLYIVSTAEASTNTDIKYSNIEFKANKSNEKVKSRMVILANKKDK